jgi:hypothetical protein
MPFECSRIAALCKTGNRLSRQRIDASKACHPFTLPLYAGYLRLFTRRRRVFESVAVLLNENSSSNGTTVSPFSEQQSNVFLYLHGLHCA